MELIQPILGLIFLFSLAWIARKARSRWSSWLVVALNVPVIGKAVAALNAVVLAVDGATRTGTMLVFG